MNRHLSYLATALLAISIIACQKEPDESILDEPVPAACQLIKAEALDGGSVDDTAGYTYTNNRISKVSYSDFYHTLQYSGNRVVKRGYFEHGNPFQVAYDTVFYNGDGTIAKIETYVTNPQIPAPVLIFQYDFMYNGGKLAQLIEKADTSFSGAAPVALYQYDYTYIGNNITQAIELDVADNLTDTLAYQYNSSPNYFANSLFTDMFFAELNGQVLPLIFSANSVIAISQSGQTHPINYTLDAKNNLKELIVDGSVVERYTWKCN
jgi:hypothetical protein